MSHKKQLFYPPPALPCTGVESHAHLIHKDFVPDFEDVLTRARAAGVERIGQVFLSPEAWHQHKSRFDAHPHIFFLLGIHPIEAHNFNDATLIAIREILISDPRMKAVGEIGLDYYWKDCPLTVQKDIFVKQIAMTKDLNLPVVIHCRDAADDTFAILESEGMRHRPLLWHCFGGDTAMALRIVENGWHLSIPGPVTYPANVALREAVAAVPLDRLMVETDCPYLAPVPMRGKRNEPAFLGYTIAAMAEAKNVPVDELWTICGDNAKSFFKL